MHVPVVKAVELASKDFNARSTPQPQIVYRRSVDHSALIEDANVQIDAGVVPAATRIVVGSDVEDDRVGRAASIDEPRIVQADRAASLAQQAKRGGKLGGQASEMRR